MHSDSYDYSYAADDGYLYSGTDVLVNNFGIKDRAELSRIERAITGARAAELDANPVPGGFDLAHLCAIHEALFGSVYPWAGKIRSRGFISKGASLFCAPGFIEPYAADLFSRLKAERFLAGLPREEFIRRISFYIAEINALHPFREGNGRTQRVFANQLARRAGWELNFQEVDPVELCDAYIRSMHVSADALESILDRTVTPA